MNPQSEIVPANPRRSSPWTAWVWIGLSSFALLGAVYWLFVQAPPPKKIVIATGSKEGQYYRFAERYALYLAKEGITLEVRPSNGSIQNLEWLLDENSGVDIALVQSGCADVAKCESLTSLGSLYREPIWVFHTMDDALTQLARLEGKRIAVGPEGSGTRAVARQLLAASGVADEAKWSQATGKEAAALLAKGEIDAAFFVAGIEAGYVGEPLRNSKIKLAELSQLGAYERRFRFLSTLTVPMGLVDLKANVPDREFRLPAAAATLVARKTLHPALVPLILGAAMHVHGGGDLLDAPGEFPSTLYSELPVDEDAVRFLKSGPPFLQRFLPFWLASFLDRMKIMLIPMIMLLMPLFRAAPPLMRWRTRRKIYKWYSRLRAIDLRLFEGMSKEDAKRTLSGLELLDQKVAYVEIPLSYMEEYYNLRVHLDLVKRRVAAILGGP